MTVLIDSYHCYLISFLDYLSTKENKDIVYLQYGYLLGVIETFREEGFDITLKEVSINSLDVPFIKAINIYDEEFLSIDSEIRSYLLWMKIIFIKMAAEIKL